MEASELGQVQPAPRNPLEVGMATVGWVLVVLAAFLCVVLTRAGLEFAHQQTCGPDPPWEWRRSVTLTATGVTAVFELVTILLLLRGRIVGLLIALVCVLVALVAPVFATLLTLFSSAMC